MSDQINYPPAIVEPENSIGVLIYLHGQGGNGTAVSESFQREAALQPFKGVFPHASIKYSQFGHPATAWIQPFGLRDTAHSTQNVRLVRLEAEFIHRMIDDEVRKGVQSSKIFVGGTGMGGALALFAGLTYPKRLAGIFVVSAWVPVKHALVNRPVANKKTPIMHVRGNADPPISPVELELNLTQIARENANIASEDEITTELAAFLHGHVNAPDPTIRFRRCKLM
uniref:palmitoyl-protein hydrolase n=1 Tax=Panagrellus redivivus TaxID=6233 RepID=A0A7E4V3L1_PANRE